MVRMKNSKGQIMRVAEGRVEEYLELGCTLVQNEAKVEALKEEPKIEPIKVEKPKAAPATQKSVKKAPVAKAEPKKATKKK